MSEDAGGERSRVAPQQGSGKTWSKRRASGADPQFERVAILGFGALGQIVATRLQTGMIPDIRAWDPALIAPPGERIRERCGWAVQLIGAEMHGLPIVSVPVIRSANVGQALREADLVIHTREDEAAALISSSVAWLLKPGAFFLDFSDRAKNSEMRAAVELALGRYVRVEVQGPSANWRSWQSMTLYGADARRLQPSLRALGFIGATTEICPST